jgi:Domain of unknown function (DUF4189)
MLRRTLSVALLLVVALLTTSCGPGFRERMQARVAQQPYYRAVAYSPSTHVCGFTQQNAGQDASIAEAIQSCGAAECNDTARWVQGSCLAVARGPGNAWGWGMDGNQHAAMREALRQCRARASGCEVACWTCTDPPP